MICLFQCFWNHSVFFFFFLVFYLLVFYLHRNVLHTLNHYLKPCMRCKTVTIDCILIELFIWLLLIYAAVLKLLSFWAIIKGSNILCNKLRLIHSCVHLVSLNIFNWFSVKYISNEKENTKDSCDKTHYSSINSLFWNIFL